MLQWETRRNLRKKAGSQPAAHGKGAVRVACYSTKLEQMLAFRTKQLQRSGLGKGEMHCRAVKKERERGKERGLRRATALERLGTTRRQYKTSTLKLCKCNAKQAV